MRMRKRLEDIKKWCANCKEFQTPAYVSCRGLCGSGDCQHRCSACNEHALIDQRFADSLIIKKTGHELIKTEGVKTALKDVLEFTDKHGGEMECRIEQQSVIITYKKEF
ncbi:MAG: hypothetical protein GBAus27B_000331 [Mycoplasmataceae bacterium]|nr:MAG: hypothetical protein GBAus27B_000331 [Mycoplasmataceae bacterium]